MDRFDACEQGRRVMTIQPLSSPLQMLEPVSHLATFKWRRTAFARIDGAVEFAENGWSLFVDGLPAARLYRVSGGPHSGKWFWAVQIGPGRVPFNSGTGHAFGGREARKACEAILQALI
jgi:hypothetical protein